MFDWLDMVGNYKERFVANTKEDHWELDTVFVTDRPWNYETAFRSPFYNDGQWIILNGFSSEEESRFYHNLIVLSLRNNPYPEAIEDIYTRELFSLEGNHERYS